MFTEDQLKSEKWKEVSGYEGVYFISSIGRLRRHSIYKLGKKKIFICKLGVQSNGYLCTNLRKEKTLTTVLMHRIVALAFIPNPNNYPEINHKNRIKTDNRIENLEWCTREQNMKHYSENYFTSSGLIKSKEEKRNNFNSTGLIENVCAIFKVKKESIFIKNRNADIVLARSIVFYLMVEKYKYTLKMAGEELGGFNHATVLHSINKIKANLRLQAIANGF